MAAGTDRTLKDFFPPAIYSERKTHTSNFPTKAADATNAEYVIFGTHHKVRIRRVDVILETAITGANTNTNNIDIVSKGTAGTGTTELASKEFITGVNAATFDRVEIYAPTTPLVLAADSVLSILLEKVGTGGSVVLGPGLAVVEYADVEEPPKR